MPREHRQAWSSGARCLLALCAALVAVPLLAQGEAIRELSRQGQTVTLGTPRFRATIEPTGTLRDVRVGDTQLISFIALYTTPTSPETGKGVRGCQAETPGLGDRPSAMDVTFADGGAQVIITRVCSHPQVLENAPLWRLRETVRLSPQGELSLQYDCRFDRLLRWGGFNVATALTMDAVRGQPLEVYLPGLTVPGEAPGTLPDRDQSVGLMGARVMSSAGPLRLWFGGTSRVHVQDWTRYLTFLASPRALPHSNMTMYRDTGFCCSVALWLPVN
ncbi:MAG: hypothetical protein KKI08_14175 [Armatimonadetes bacterium]|nr:hypothetical protein [Armatimonadota bacterium]